MKESLKITVHVFFLKVVCVYIIFYPSVNYNKLLRSNDFVANYIGIRSIKTFFKEFSLSKQIISLANVLSYLSNLHHRYNSHNII